MSLLRRQLRGFPPTWLAYWIRPGVHWPIPGFSQWWSRRLKSWLKEIEPANFWTFHRPVGGTFDSAIQQTLYGFSSRFFYVLTACSCRCEDCLLLFRAANMDCPDTVAVADATHFLYWPIVLLPIIIGPHLSNDECNRARV
jgi:hypothetical protein